MSKKMSRERGRPRSRHLTNDGFTALDYLSTIIIKYGIDSKDLFNCLLEAFENQESEFGDFAIQVRKEKKETVIFLITKNAKVVAQLPIPKQLLKGPNPFKDFVPTQKARRIMPEISENEHPQIKDLKFGMKQINLEARVVDISQPKNVFSRVGKLIRVASATISDETGSIQLPLWNQQIHTVVVGDTVQVENARVVTFGGELQLRVGSGGQLSVIEKCAHFQ